MHTRRVPLCSDQMEGSRSTLSPKVYGKGGPLAIAEATADLRNSMVLGTDAREFGNGGVGSYSARGAGSESSSRGASCFKKEAIANEAQPVNVIAACLARQTEETGGRSARAAAATPQQGSTNRRILICPCCPFPTFSLLRNISRRRVTNSVRGTANI